MDYYIDYLETPIGLIKIEANKKYITCVEFVDYKTKIAASELTEKCKTQLDQYFKGERKNFELPLFYDVGTSFQQCVWQNLLAVEFGKTACYQDIAIAVGSPKAVRAVGGANNKNPISIIVPCHRIVGKTGKLIGYGGGLWRKEWLLAHEGAYKNSFA